MVVEGTSCDALRHGPGHERDTRFPGQPGVSILQGRAAAFGGPFGDIDRLRTGDEITVVTGQDTATFRVTGSRRLRAEGRAGQAKGNLKQAGAKAKYALRH